MKLSIRKLEEYGFQPRFIIQRECNYNNIQQPLTLKKFCLSGSAIDRGGVLEFPKINTVPTISAGSDRELIPIRLKNWQNNSDRDEVVYLTVSVNDTQPITVPITLHHEKTLPAFKSPVVAEILKILDTEVNCKVQLLSLEEFGTINSDLLIKTDPALTFALLFPLEAFVAVMNCLTTFLEILPSQLEHIYGDTKLVLRVMKLLQLPKAQKAQGIFERIFTPNFAKLTIEAKRTLRCMEHRPCQPDSIAAKTLRSTEQVEQTLKKLQEEKLIQRIKTSNYYEITKKGQKTLDQYRT